MTSFLHRFGSLLHGVLSGFDRMRFRGTLLRMAHVAGMSGWLNAHGILLKDFKEYAQDRTDQLRRSVLARAEEAGCPVEYLNSYKDKEALVQQRLQKRSVAPGDLICVLSTLENCTSYSVHSSAKNHTITLRREPRKCLHYYFYFQDERFGVSHVRLQTWLPFSTHVVINGREWLAHDLDRAGLGYQRRDNCFTWIEDFARAQELADAQARIHWPAELDRLVNRMLPPRELWLPEFYYWTIEQSEWATDLAFRDPADLARLYPRLVRHGIETFGSEDVLRFLGRSVPPTGGVPPRLRMEVTSDVKHRAEGVRIKHRAGRNSIKLYDKQGSVLRVETTLNDVKGMKSYRPKADDPEGPPCWQPMRKSVVELPRRAELSQASNERYLEALGAVPPATPLGELTARLCRPVVVEGRRYRALNPLGEDARLLGVISRGEFLITGFRNRDIREALHGSESDAEKRRRQAGAVTRLLGILRAHGLIKKVPRTHRYLLTVQGTSVIPALLAANKATLEQLKAAA